MTPRIYIYPQGGADFQVLDLESLTLTREANKTGTMEIVCTPQTFNELGCQIVVDARHEREVYWEVKEVSREKFGNTDRVTLRCEDGIGKLKERIIFGYTDTALGYKIGPTPKVIEELIQQQLVSPADSSRGLAGTLVDFTNFSSPPYPVYEAEVGWRNLLEVVQEVCDYSAGLGYPLLINAHRIGRGLRFRVSAVGPPTNTLPLRAFENYGAQYTIVSSILDRVTRVYVGGDGRDSDKLVIPVDKALPSFGNFQIAPHVFYAEKFIDLGAEDDLDVLRTQGTAELVRSLPRNGITLTGSIPTEEFWGTELSFMQGIRADTPYGSFDVYLTSYTYSFEGPVAPSVEYTMKELIQ